MPHPASAGVDIVVIAKVNKMLDSTSLFADMVKTPVPSKDSGPLYGRISKKCGVVGWDVNFNKSS